MKEIVTKQKSVVQISEQGCIWKNIEKLKNRIDVKILSNKNGHLKWLFKMDIQTKLYVTQNI